MSRKNNTSIRRANHRALIDAEKARELKSQHAKGKTQAKIKRERQELRALKGGSLSSLAETHHFGSFKFARRADSLHAEGLADTVNGAPRLFAADAFDGDNMDETEAAAVAEAAAARIRFAALKAKAEALEEAGASDTNKAAKVASAIRLVGKRIIRERRAAERTERVAEKRAQLFGRGETVLDPSKVERRREKARRDAVTKRARRAVPVVRAGTAKERKIRRLAEAAADAEDDMA